MCNQAKRKGYFYMIKAIEKNLERGIQLLNSITDSEYSNATVPSLFF